MNNKENASRLLVYFFQWQKGMICFSSERCWSVTLWLEVWVTGWATQQVPAFFMSQLFILYFAKMFHWISEKKRKSWSDVYSSFTVDVVHVFIIWAVWTEIWQSVFIFRSDLSVCYLQYIKYCNIVLHIVNKRYTATQHEWERSIGFGVFSSSFFCVYILRTVVTVVTSQ